MLQPFFHIWAESERMASVYCLNPALHAFNVFILHVTRMAYMSVCLHACVKTLHPWPFERLIKRSHHSHLTFPASARTSAAHSLVFARLSPTPTSSSLWSTSRSSRMVSTASTAAMDLTQVIPAWLDGVAQELGMEKREFKLVLAGDPGQFGPKPVQQLMQDYNQIEWEFVRCNPLDTHLESGWRMTSRSWLRTAPPRLPLRATSKDSASLPVVNAQSLCTRSAATARAWVLWQIQDDLLDGTRLLQQGSH